MSDVRILLAHHDAACTHALRSLLQSANYDVVCTATSPEEAVFFTGQYKPDLVLLEAAEHGAASTFAAANDIAGRYAVPVLCLTAPGDQVAAQRCSAAGDVACLRTPYEDWEVLLSIKKSLEHGSAAAVQAGKHTEVDDGCLADSFEHEPIGKALIATNGSFLKVNRAFRELTGYGEHELTGRTVQSVLVFQQGKENLSERFERGEQRIIGEQGRCRRRDGRELPVLINAAVGNNDKRKAPYLILQVLQHGVSGSMDEALQESEQRLKKLVEATTSYLYTVIVDQGKPVATKHEPGCVFVTGYAAEEYDGDPELWYRMVHEDDRREVLKQIHAVLAGESTKPIEHRIMHKTGALRWVRNTPVPHYDREGRLISYDGLITCITQERALKDQLHQAQKMEAVGQLAGGIAHDFNNILTAIIGCATLLRMKLSEHDPVQTEVDQILGATERAAKLTERLLSFSRKQTSRPRPVRVDEVVQQVGKLLGRVLGEDIRMKTMFAAGTVTIMSDAWQLEQALINLATNARDAMPSGGELMIETGTVRLDEDFITMHGYGEVGSFACITVTDSGSGMDKETLSRIFEPFFTTKEVGKGTGLGLAIVYGIVKQHRGYINVYSEPGKGTTFRLYLPMIADAAASAAIARTVPLRGKETVLLAEDDGDVRRSTKSLLESYGYRVIEALDGEEAVSKFREYGTSIDFLILDIVMPKKTGKEAYEEIKRTRPDIKAIFTSGYTGDLVRLRGVAEQDWNFVSKPILPAEFSQKIREVLAA